MFSIVFFSVVKGKDTIVFTVRLILAASRSFTKSNVGPSGWPAHSLALRLSMVTLSIEAKIDDKSLAEKSSSSRFDDRHESSVA